MATQVQTQTLSADAIEMAKTLIGDKIDEFYEVKQELSALIDEYPEVFEKFVTLAETYNANLSDVKNSIRSVPGTGGVSFRGTPFRRSVGKPCYVFVPGTIPANILSMPGVVKTVDSSVLTALMDSHHDAGVREALEELAVPSTTVCKVYGPKEIVIQIDAGDE